MSPLLDLSLHTRAVPVCPATRAILWGSPETIAGAFREVRELPPDGRYVLVTNGEGRDWVVSRAQLREATR